VSRYNCVVLTFSTELLRPATSTACCRCSCIVPAAAG